MLLYMPTKVYSQRDCIINHAKEIASLGKKAMIVTGKQSARKCGALQDIEDVLQQENLSYMLFDEIEENPSIETVMKARDFGIG